MEPLAPDVLKITLMPRHGINAYLVGDVLVDTGVPGSASKILREVRDAGREVRAIACTHAHPDHAGGISRLLRELDVPVWVGAGDRAFAETGELPVQPPMDKPGLRTVAGFAGSFDGVSVDRDLHEGDEIGAGFVVLETPGHSPGHVAFWREADRVLVCGDVFFNLSLATLTYGLRQPPGLFTPDPARNRESERRLALLEPDVVGFGHGPLLRDAAPVLSAFVAGLPDDGPVRSA